MVGKEIRSLQRGDDVSVVTRGVNLYRHLAAVQRSNQKNRLDFLQACAMPLNDANKQGKQAWLGLEDDSDAENVAESEEESRVKSILREHSTKQRRLNKTESEGEDEEEEKKDAIDQQVGDVDIGSAEAKALVDTNAHGGTTGQATQLTVSESLITNPLKLRPLSKEELAASKAATAKTGVVYLSRIPVC